jgi:hypothetical protein
MHDKSYAHRGYFTKASFDAIEKLLKNADFRETIHSRTAQVSSVFRIAVGIGLEELERHYAEKAAQKAEQKGDKTE